MATGDDAAAAGMDLVAQSGASGKVKNGATEINKTRDYLAQKIAAVMAAISSHTHAASAIVSGLLAVARIPHLSSYQTDDRVYLGTKPTDPTATSGNTYIGVGDDTTNAFWVTRDGNQKFIVDTNGDAWATRDATAGRDIFAGRDIATDRHFYTNGATAASSGWIVAYINGDGRIAAGASSEVFKDDIIAIDPVALGDLFPVLHEFVMRDDPGRMVRVGYIAERLNESDDLRRFVVYEREQVRDDDGNIVGSRLVKDADGNPVPYSIDFIALLIAQTAQLNVRLAALETRLAAIDGA